LKARGGTGSRAGRRVGVQGSTPQGRDNHQGRCHLATPARGPALVSLSTPELQTRNAISLGKVWPKARVVHRRRARRLRLRLSQHQSRWDPKGRRQIRRDGAWVRREQSRGSWDPPAHFREAPTRRYSGYQQPFPSRAGSQNAHVVLLGRKSPTAVPH